jgi:hypothetical protein
VVFGYRHPAWVAVQTAHFTQPIARVAVPVHATAGIVSTAPPLAGPHATVARRGAFGPPVANISQATGRPVRPVAAATVVSHPRGSMPVATPGARGVMRSPAPAPRAQPAPSAPAPSGKGGAHPHAGGGKTK